jgi:hypothetical protein
MRNRRQVLLAITCAAMLLQCSSLTPVDWNGGIGNGNAQYRHLLSGHMYYSNGDPVCYSEGLVTAVPVDYNPLDPAYRHGPQNREITVGFDSNCKYTFDSLDCRRYSIFATAINWKHPGTPSNARNLEFLFKEVNVTLDMEGFPNDTLRPGSGTLQIKAHLRPYPSCSLALGIIGTNIWQFSGSGNFSDIDLPAGSYRIVIRPMKPIRPDTIFDVEIANDTTIQLAVDFPFIPNPGKDPAMTEKFLKIKSCLPGSYTGTTDCAWWNQHRVVFTIDSNGHYGGYNADYLEGPLLYFGQDSDDVRKVISLDKIGYDGSAGGSIWIGYPKINADSLRGMHFSANFDSLFFEIWHDDIHYLTGPQYFALRRTAVDSLPPRPLPLPTIYATGELLPVRVPEDYGTFTDTVTITITAMDGSTIFYQILDEPRGWLLASYESYLAGLYPIAYVNDTWSDYRPTYTYTGPFTITEKPYFKTILARAVKGPQRSGPAGFNVIIVGQN